MPQSARLEDLFFSLTEGREADGQAPALEPAAAVKGAG